MEPGDRRRSIAHILYHAAMLCLLLVVVNCVGGEPLRLDLSSDEARQIVVDREPGVYLGHVSTVLLDADETILAAYPQGHGRGPIVLKRSDDGGRTWSDRLSTPDSWTTSKETPTVFNLGNGSLILFSGLYPIRAARSDDAGESWSEIDPIGDFGGIVAMGGLLQRGEGEFSAFFHDDGRFFAAPAAGESANPATGTFSIYQTDSEDGSATWSFPRAIWSGEDLHLCEPGVVQSPDGETTALLLRENRRAKNSHVMFSDDNARKWSAPHELPDSLTGDRHIAKYAPDGRLVITFRCMKKGDPWQGDWVAWVGTWEQIEQTAKTLEGDSDDAARPAYLVRLKDNLTSWDCGYAGLEALADGTLVATTYGTWLEGEHPFILSVRFTLAELDAIAADARTE